MMNSRTSKLDHILTLEKPSKDQRGLGFKSEVYGYNVLKANVPIVVATSESLVGKTTVVVVGLV